MEQVKDLTRGNIRSQLIVLAVPLLIGNLLQQLYNTVDATLIGRFLGQDAFAAVGVAGSIMNLFLFLLAGACNGISVLFSQLYGEKNWEALRRESFLSGTFGMALTVLLTLLGLLTLSPLLTVIRTPAEVVPHAARYLRMIYLGLPATFLYNWCSGALRAVGDTKASLWILLFAMLTNLGLDLLFLTCTGLGIFGVALATVLAQALSGIACLWYLRRKRSFLLFSRADCVLDLPLLRKTASFGIVSALHQSSLYIGKLFIQSAVNSAGTSAIAAFTAATRIEAFANSFGDSTAAAMAVLIGQNYGAGNKDRLRTGFWTGLRLHLLLGAGASLLMIGTATVTLPLVLGQTDAGTLQSAGQYLRTVSLFYVLCFVGNNFVGFFRGVGMVRIPFFGTTLHLTLRVILSFLWISSLGLPAVGWATGLGWISVVLFQILVFRKNRSRWS